MMRSTTCALAGAALVTWGGAGALLVVLALGQLVHRRRKLRKATRRMLAVAERFKREGAQ